MRILENLRVPRAIAALILLFCFFGAIVGIGAALSTPAAEWLQRLPQGIPRLEERLSFLRQPIGIMRNFLQHAEKLAQIDAPAMVTSAPVVSPSVAPPQPMTPPQPAPQPTHVVAQPSAPADGASLSHRIVVGTWTFAAGFATTILMLFFLLISGDTFLRRLVEILPSFRNKRQVVDISQQIEADISIYLATITLMNGLVGTTMGLVMWVSGAGDPVLWGTVAFLLNYVPIIGPLVGAGVFLLVGLLTIQVLWLALLPAGLYLAVHVIEGEIVTPLLLARRFTLNPVVVMMTLVFWFWMWGVPGAILSVPMLAMAKIICDRIEPLKAVGHFLSGDGGTLTRKSG
jgi:predicted PurR-regulated permease PerM